MTCDSPKYYTCKVCKKLKGHDSWSTTGQKRTIWLVSYFATGTRNLSQSRVSCQNTLFCKYMTFHILHIPYHKYPYTHKMLRAWRGNFERETLEKNKIDSSTILYLWFSNSSTLTLSIDIPLRIYFAKSLSRHTHISEKVIWSLGNSLEMTNSFG